MAQPSVAATEAVPVSPTKAATVSPTAPAAAEAAAAEVAKPSVSPTAPVSTKAAPVSPTAPVSWEMASKLTGRLTTRVLVRLAVSVVRVTSSWWCAVEYFMGSLAAMAVASSWWCAVQLVFVKLWAGCEYPLSGAVLTRGIETQCTSRR